MTSTSCFLVKKLLLLLPLAAGAAASDSTASVDTTFVLTHPAKVARAVRVDVAPVIDGVLDDEAWKVAPLHGDFTQKDPVDGAEPTEKTTFQIVYDDEAIYVAATCLDSEPDKIISRLARRDDWGVRDVFNVNLDPHHDHQTGYFFVVGPSGYMGDGIIYNDGAEDESWDGIWHARTSIHEQGWTAEIKIPYYVLRFEDDHFVFGELESRLFEVEVHSSVAFTPTLTLEFFMKPFVTTGDYRNIKELASPASYDFIPYEDLEDNPDFSSRSLRSTLVLRWEYRPGSTLFAVWQQNRSWEHDGPLNPDLAPLGGLRSTFVDDGDNIFLVKLNRWFGL